MSLQKIKFVCEQEGPGTRPLSYIVSHKVKVHHVTNQFNSLTLSSKTVPSERCGGRRDVV